MIVLYYIPSYPCTWPHLSLRRPEQHVEHFTLVVLAEISVVDIPEKQLQLYPLLD